MVFKLFNTIIAASISRWQKLVFHDGMQVDDEHVRAQRAGHVPTALNPSPAEQLLAGQDT